MQTRQIEIFRIGGMSCAHCVNAVRESLKTVPGVEVQDVQIGHAVVAYDPDETDRDGIVEAIARVGYDVEPQRQV